jgi:hypothetical protein
MARIRLLTCMSPIGPVGRRFVSLFEGPDNGTWKPFELMLMSWEVELRGFEPRTSCMPCETKLSSTVSNLGQRVSAGPSKYRKVRPRWCRQWVSVRRDLVLPVSAVGSAIANRRRWTPHKAKAAVAYIRSHA